MKVQWTETISPKLVAALAFIIFIGNWFITCTFAQHGVSSYANETEWQMKQKHDSNEWRRASKCTIDKLDEETWRNRFLSQYHLQQPAILRWKNSVVTVLQERTKQDRFLQDFGRITVLVGSTAELAWSGQARHPMTLEKYMASLPSQKYLFDAGEFMNQSGLDRDWTTVPGFDSLGTFEDRKVGKQSFKLTFALGGDGQGIPFHWHQDAYNLQLHGRKHWAIYAPHKMTSTGFSVFESHTTWLQKQSYEKNFVPPTWECVQEPGDVLYIPEGFFHATACFGESVAVAHQASGSISMPPTAWGFSLSAQQVSDTKKGIELIKRAIKLDTSNAHLWVVRGLLEGREHRWEKAVKSLRNAVMLNPMCPQARGHLMIALHQLGRSEEVQLVDQDAKQFGDLVQQSSKQFYNKILSMQARSSANSKSEL